MRRWPGSGSGGRAVASRKIGSKSHAKAPSSVAVTVALHPRRCELLLGGVGVEDRERLHGLVERRELVGGGEEPPHVLDARAQHLRRRLDDHEGR